MARKHLPADTESHRLLNLWCPEDGFGSAIGCVASTFTLDAGHFEEQCLARFISMETDAKENARAYLIEREEKLSQVFACVLADQRHAQDQRSLRWHLLPVRLPGSSIQHSKISVLMWEQHLRIIIGSANLTPAGYRLNRETVGVLEFSPEGDQPLSLARECLDFVATLAGFTPGDEATPSPRQGLATFLADVRRRISPWTDKNFASGKPRCALIPVIPSAGGRASSLIEQIRGLWRGPAAQDLTVMSPFYDQTTSSIDRTYNALSQLVTTRGARTITFCASGRELADGTLEIDIPKRLVKSRDQHKLTEHAVQYVETLSASDGDVHRPLHTKGLLLEYPSFRICVIGSSNCTVSGLGLSPKPNAELNIAFLVRGSISAYWKKCVKALPETLPVTDLEQVSFVETLEASEGELLGIPLLPPAFIEALFLPQGTTGLLQLRLDPQTVPGAFEVVLPDGTLVLTNETWAGQFNRQADVSLPVEGSFSVLTVRWRDEVGIWCSAPWVVNVTDTALLPPPEELRNLSLKELLAILTSARPLHIVLEKRLAMRSDQTSTLPTAVDPHKKVDTTQFVMRRMRRLARALEGLRDRLELPVTTPEGLRWRLYGPLGPIALANALLAESGDGGPFFVAEVAMTVDEVRWHLAGAFKRSDLDAEVAGALASLKALALERAAESPENLRDYVSDELSRIGQ